MDANLQDLMNQVDELNTQSIALRQEIEERTAEFSRLFNETMTQQIKGMGQLIQDLKELVAILKPL